jgi:arginine deiminase
MKTTYQSDYGKLKSVFIKRPKEAFVDEKQVASQWKELNFLSKPDLSKAEAEYAEFDKGLSHLRCPSIHRLLWILFIAGMLLLPRTME